MNAIHKWIEQRIALLIVGTKPTQAHGHSCS